MKRGFTLIEVLVTMAIVSILAGIMVPAAWKMWESQEIQTTRDRLNTLKLAMIGDKNLVQNGIRTSYGFVGDNGELPFANSSSSASLSFLVNRPLNDYPHWNGPYMSGFEPTEYRKDAWGNAIDYRACITSDDRYLSGALRSGGLNGKLDAAYDSCDSNNSATFCIGDDICVALDLKEVAPAEVIKGNVSSSFTGSNKSHKIFVERADGSTPPLSSSCLPLVTSPVFGVYSAKGARLPIGNAKIYGTFYSDLNCTTLVPTTSPKYNIFISDGLSAVPYNLNLTY
jgi:prepilin-type N-terminal cleavage/methylation domain-containing protein